MNMEATAITHLERENHRNQTSIPKIFPLEKALQVGKQSSARRSWRNKWLTGENGDLWGDYVYFPPKKNNMSPEKGLVR